ncbi:cytochrome d ubiquinol oxidase subunit II [Corynebacterium guangdongense]|uniref:Cytochrome d ubiquinol oxidase subunit II n=1 Tax=Corynebacterium guangdongense TaxID=1783348 RepID=A0ABU1ZZ55_9CORY|nr:cytochrome d ubiquinol oxidase subunit II [Corynebacterium guangdongense]MDR7330210.1 cytochrome d ubiquinol oxidase subunit II [Corynebacterium guangdongense]WJZ18768.1 Cytochrome bd-I ubiquinol oxidase subunit 2 [Corynebacterium guangdongense]
MDLQTLWFIIIAFFFVGYFLLEGFDFGVGMLLPFLGGRDAEERAARRSAAVKAIGPIWDGNEVWLITAGAALFASFPEWYATMFSGFYLPLLLILLSLILRGVGLEWRTKVDTQKWRDVSDVFTAVGSWVPALLWGVAFANILRGVAIDADRQIESGLTGLIALLNPVGLLGGLTFVALFLLHGAMFLGFKTEEPLRSRVHDIGLKWLTAPAVALTLGFALWIQYDSGKPAGWAIIAAMVVSIAVGVVSLIGKRDGWAFASTAVAVVGLVVLIFVSLFPYLMPTTLEGGVSLDIYNSASSDYTLKIMGWAALLFIPGVLVFQGWTYWVFRKRVKVVAHTTSTI